MGVKQAHEPASTPSVTPVVAEPDTYGWLVGLLVGGAAAVAAWFVIRVARRRSS